MRVRARSFLNPCFRIPQLRDNFCDLLDTRIAVLARTKVESGGILITVMPEEPLGERDVSG